MQKVLLDTSFIISCAREKIDFIQELQEYEVLIPEQVIQETFKVSQDSEQSLKDRNCAELALKILYSCQSSFKRIDICNDKLKDVDDLIVHYAKSNLDVIVATLDKGLKEKIGKKALMTIFDKNKIGLI